MKKLLRKASQAWLAVILCSPSAEIFAQSYASVNNFSARGSYHKSASLKQSSLEDVLVEIQKKYNVRFAFNDEVISKKVVSSFPSLGDDLNKSLTEILKPLGLTYEVLENNYYVIYPTNKRSEATRLKAKALSQLNSSNSGLNTINGASASVMQNVVTGKVTNSEDGVPLPGVNIMVKGTSNGASSDFDGNYSINVADENATLVFTYIGFKEIEVPLNGRSVVNVSLESDVSALDEVVVVGYGTQKKSDLTGSISSVGSEEISKVTEVTVEAALQGRAAGVNIQRGEGSPGSSSKISIRGAGSIGNTGPLWVVDGVPQDPGNYFNPNDIESVEILKDASASAIYGARAAHGVILVTTKRGKEGKVQVNFDTTVGFRDAVRLPDMLNRDQYILLSTEARENGNTNPDPSWSNPSELPDTDWEDALFRTGIVQTNNLSLSGGGENANFFVSVGNQSEQGIMVNNEFDKYNLRANSDFKIGKILKLGESLMVSRTELNPTSDDGRDLLYLYRAVPTHPLYDETNPYGGWGQSPGYNAGPNPVGLQYQNHALNKTTRINGNIYGELEPVKGLTLRGSFGFNLSDNLNRNFREAFDYGNQSNLTSELSYYNANSEAFNTNVTLTFDRTFGKHNVKALAGYEKFTNDGVDFGANGVDFPVPYSESLGLATGELTVTSRNSINQQYRLNSYFGRLNYSFAGKYLLTANIRHDGSSRFGSANQYGTFPSFSAGWNISKESFMQDVSAISNLKLRASYGTLGSDAINDYLFSSVYVNDSSFYIFNATGVDDGNVSTGYYLDRFANQAVKWEEISQLDFGLDIGFFRNQLNITADYYIKKTTDMLIPVQLPLSYGVSASAGNTGVNSVPVNLGEMENEGIEFTVDFSKSVGNWDFNILANAAWNRNLLLSLEGANEEIFRTGGNPAFGPQGATISVTEENNPISSFYGYVVEGVFQDQPTIDALNAGAPDGVYQSNGTSPGDFYYKDLDGDGEITEEDRTVLGNPWPELTYGLNATIAYKGLDLTMFFQGVSGVDVFNLTRSYARGFYGDYNSSTQAFDRWTPSNPSSSHPRLATGDPNGNLSQPSSYFVEDGSYLKLRNIQLGYSIPTDVLSKFGFTKARVFINAQNILTITNYDGLDPEVSNGDGGNTLQNVDGLSKYPQTRLISTGLQLGF
ncbi:SusC/RagA family TonB-linked outer membrane protein [Galbibacter mesophilus]|uniref:SusC/RagA family TonB-linked outer membrane protein n=1 Tax=Galbibacter mesophilus TaxID=379069 RepID=UPI00191FD02C|nr:SusC/RagA family TonB-linked outer membrane protein [Galbibacter mesophilus]MCM5663881.1 SusC/RagA family TonB-linked outer membrane protein [Galbibacter mesophilus]